MDRLAFEALRDLPGKTIRGDIRFVRRQATAPLLIAEDIRIENEHSVDARLTISFNPEVGSKTFNVHVVGLGPICRLDVDGTPHRPHGRTHKHSLMTERCPDQNLRRGVDDRADLAGLPLATLFQKFCRMATIAHEGRFEVPEEAREGNET